MRCMLALLGVAVALSSCSRRQDAVTTPPEPEDATPPAVARPEAGAAADAGDAAPEKVASLYFAALFSGDADAATRLAATPFSLDRKEILRDMKAVESAHESIVGRKGKRPVPEHTIGRTDRAPALDPGVFAGHVAFRIMIDDEHIDVYVSKEAPHKVIGFSD